MKLLWVFLLALAAAIFVAEALPRQENRERREVDEYPEVDEEGMDEDDGDDHTDEDDTEQVAPRVNTRKNPCDKKKCKRGEMCYLDKNEKAKCKCRTTCIPDPNPRYMVCSNKNQTFDSECHLDREVCWCRRNRPECGNPSFKNLRLDYYGECKKISPCEDWEMEQFPLRTRNWMFAVMKELARRHEIKGYYEGMLKTAAEDDKHADAVIWKFCDLDVHPTDRFVTRREMLFVIASIKPMEHCLTPFLDLCDANKDRKISLHEWGACLGITADKIQDKCKAVHKKNRT